MSIDLLRAAHAVFLPAFDGWNFHNVMDPFLAGGGCSILIGESREEYVGRRMHDARRAEETPAIFRRHIDDLKTKAGGQLIVAVDEELAGIRRLEGLVPDLPTLEDALAMDDMDIETRCYQTAKAAVSLGVSMFLAPILDVIDGENQWLAERHLGGDASEVGRIGAAFVRGVQRAGITAVAKHFPGFNHLEADPALTDVALTTGLDTLTANSQPFTAAIAAGTKAVMAGPARVTTLDPENAACTSPNVIALLRDRFGFSGLVVSDDLDAPATMRDASLLDTAIASLNAGVDLLLVAGGPHLEELCGGVAAAVADGRLPMARLLEAAERVRANAAGK